MLFEYQKMCQRFLRDSEQKYVNPDDLINYINRARRQIALRTQCVRVLSPVSGSVATATIATPGAGYVTPVATISAPDFPSGKGTYPLGNQATADIQQIGGVITNIGIPNGGSGYYTPTITITDSTGPGTGATATVATSPVLQTQNGQEVYNFADVPLAEFPGVGQVFWVNSISIIYSAYRYSLMVYSFSTYQATIRNYPQNYRYVPSVCAQLGRGTNGSLYLYPISAQPYQLEWDCYCLPQDLSTDESEEAIPQPWQDLVPYLATHLAFLELQNLNAANYYLNLFDSQISSYSGWVAQRRVPNRYGRWAILPFILPALDALQHLVGPLVS